MPSGDHDEQIHHPFIPFISPLTLLKATTMHHRCTHRTEHLPHHDHRQHGIHHRSSSNNNNSNNINDDDDDDSGNGSNGHYKQQPQSDAMTMDTQPFLNHSTGPRRHPPTAEGEEIKSERFIENMIKIFIALFAATAFSISYNLSSGNGIAGHYAGAGGSAGDGTSRNYMGTKVGKLRTHSDGWNDPFQPRYESNSDSQSHMPL
mmetsp:Transcript_23570/g.49406  ORF Transcript_23570/g.49406 Transcript_23570/m.49406 type:complete len:204 (-) Transcript_23570:21-632(-)